MVQAGELELGWVGSRAFDVLGVPTLQALQAPFLIDDYPLLHAVLTSDLPARMLTGLQNIDLVGLGLFPDGLRHPIGFNRPFLSLDDFRDAGFRVPPSNAADALFRALGAEPKHLNGPAIDAALTAGEIEGIELSIGLTPVFGAAHVPAGLALYPRVNTLFASDRVMRALTTEQQEAVRMATADAQEFALEELPDQDDSVPVCAAGGAVVVVQPSDVDAIIDAAEPVYAVMEADPVTRDVVSDIRKLKESTPEAPALKSCSNVPPPTPSPTARTDVHPLVGSWRTPRLSAQQIAGRLDDAGFTPEEYATVADWFDDSIMYTIEIGEDGRWIQGDINDDGPDEVGWVGTWEIIGDALVKTTEDRRAAPIDLTFRWSMEGDELRLEMVDHPSDRFEDMIVTQIFTTAPFIRVR
jgi:TRAP-type C4-dicarboxylate transport system substrate-binding protein